MVNALLCVRARPITAPIIPHAMRSNVLNLFKHALITTMINPKLIGAGNDHSKASIPAGVNALGDKASAAASNAEKVLDTRAQPWVPCRRCRWHSDQA